MSWTLESSLLDIYKAGAPAVNVGARQVADEVQQTIAHLAGAAHFGSRMLKCDDDGYLILSVQTRPDFFDDVHDSSQHATRVLVAQDETYDWVPLQAPGKGALMIGGFDPTGTPCDFLIDDHGAAAVALAKSDGTVQYLAVAEHGSLPVAGWNGDHGLVALQLDDDDKLKVIDADLATAIGELHAILSDVYDAANHCLAVKVITP